MTKTELQRVNDELAKELESYKSWYEIYRDELHCLKMKHDPEYIKQQARISASNYKFFQRYPHRIID